MSLTTQQYARAAGYGGFSSEPIQVGSTLIAGPTLEPITVADAKRHCRIDVDDDNASVNDWIKASRAQVEYDTSLKLYTQTWDLTLDAFPSWRQPISLPFGPLQSVTSIKYYDSTNTLQTWASSNYTTDTSSATPRIGLTDTGDWPSDLRIFQPGLVRVVVGWASVTSIPENLRHAVRLIIGQLMKSREPVVDSRFAIEVPLGYAALIAPHILYAVG